MASIAVANVAVEELFYLLEIIVTDFTEEEFNY